MNRFEKAQEELNKELASLDNLNLESETLEVTINSFGIKIITSKPGLKERNTGEQVEAEEAFED